MTRWRLHRTAEPQRGLPTAVLLASIFVGLVLIVRLLCNDQLSDSSFWPANVALVVAFLVLPRRLGLWTGIACLAANLLLNRFSDFGLYDNVLFSLLNVAVSYLTAFLTRSLCGAAIDLTRVRRLSVFIGICFVSAGAEACLGDLLDPVAASDNGSMVQDWLQWTLCDGLGLLLGVPAILFAVKSRQADLAGDAGRCERWILLFGTVLLSILAFAWARTPLILMLYPVLILTAFRAGPAWVLACVLLACLIASAMTAHGYGPLVLLSPHGSRMREDMMQPYLVSLFLAAVPANNALGEKNRIARRLRRLKAAVEHEATHDALTTLANRDLFRRRLAAALQASLVRAVIFIDLDRFKEVNDTLGHQAGDELLRAFSSRLMAATPANTLIARFGGDEFAVLLEENSEVLDIDDLCSAIVATARAPFVLAHGTAHVSASVGVAFMPVQPVEVGELLRMADIALYDAKAIGRDGYRFFSHELDGQVQQKAELETDLRAALDGAGGLLLHYQLKLDRGGAVRGVEALVRWNHPRYGPLAPPRFISVAEETGLILPLGAWVFREAVAFAARWPQLHVAVNVSPIQLRHAGFVEDVLATLCHSSVSAGRIELEVTETVFLDEISPATNSLRRLREAGLRIALDDFGTGYSSMRQLQRFKVDRLKIDRSFVASLGVASLSVAGMSVASLGAAGGGEGSEPAAIVQAIVRLGHAMGLQVTAEGIETEAQRDFLATTGVDEFQGFYFARPTDEATLATRLQRTPTLEAA